MVQEVMYISENEGPVANLETCPFTLRTVVWYSISKALAQTGNVFDYIFITDVLIHV